MGSCARAWPCKSYCENALILLKSSPLIQGIGQTNLMTKERFTKIFNFMTPGTGVLVLGHGLVSHIVKMKSFFLLMSIDQTK